MQSPEVVEHEGRWIVRIPTQSTPIELRCATEAMARATAARLARLDPRARAVVGARPVGG